MCCLHRSSRFNSNHISYHLCATVIFGIGLDDAFIIVGEYRRTCVTDSLPKRIQDTIRHVGLSIAMTSVTSAVAFGLGGLSSVRAARWMALYGFPAIIFNFLYQITFFVACMVRVPLNFFFHCQ